MPSTSFRNPQETMQLQEMMEEVLILQRDGISTHDTVARVREIVSDCQSIVERDQIGASEMVIDGEILSKSGIIVKNYVHNFDTNLMVFVPEEYASGIISHIESNSMESLQDWDILASETFSMFKKIPPLNYMLGTFKLDPPPVPDRVRAQRQRKEPDAPRSVVPAVTVNTTDGSEAQVPDEIYQHILKCLIDRFRGGGRQPVSYFKFVIDPTDFWKSVQNVFHFSFLVRDDKVKMFLNDDGLPVVEPAARNRPDGASQERSTNFQFNFRLTPSEYRKIIAAFEISDPWITPFRQT